MAPVNLQDAAAYRQLRLRREKGDALRPDDAEELARLEALYDAADALRLAEAAARVRQETDGISFQNRQLQDLLRRKTALADRLDTLLAELQREQQAMDNEVARLLSADETVHQAVRAT